MGDLNPFKKPKIDTSAIDRQEAELKKQNAKLKKEEQEAVKKERSRQDNIVSRARRGSLLSGLETGVQDKRETLG